MEMMQEYCMVALDVFCKFAYAKVGNERTGRRKPMIPNDPMMLLSYINTQLRDFYPSLEAFCKAQDVKEDSIREKLRNVDYEYDEKLNKFV